jgi:hypothetical protein
MSADDFVEDWGKLKKEIDSLKEQLRVAQKIEDSFWAAIKLLNLSAIDVNNPGSHVVAVINERSRYKTALEWIASVAVCDNDTLRAKAREALGKAI